MSNDYTDIANTSWENIPEPKLLPDGTWRLRLRNASYQPSKDEDKSPTVLFVYNAKEAMSDVSEDELTKLGQNYDVEANRIFTRFYVNDASDWANVRKHLEKHGVKPEGNIIQSLKIAKNAEVLAYLSQRNFTANGEVREENVATSFASIA